MTTEHIEARAAFLYRLRARGLADLAVLRALEGVPRDAFVPHRFADLANKDVALPLPCGQAMTEPSLVALMIQALAVAPGHRVLEIGSGSGYGTAVLARLGGEILGVERFRTLARSAGRRLSSLGVTGAAVVWGDGLGVPPERGPFDRILVHGLLDGVPPALDALLTADGAMVFARAGADRQSAVRARRAPDGAWDVKPVAPSRLRRLYDGPSRML